jgi:hypothetical protein
MPRNGCIDWLKERHPDWPNLREKTEHTSVETRFSITSLPAGPAAILAATRAHYWQLDIPFDEDRCQTSKDFSPSGSGACLLTI